MIWIPAPIAFTLFIILLKKNCSTLLYRSRQVLKSSFDLLRFSDWWFLCRKMWNVVFFTYQITEEKRVLETTCAGILDLPAFVFPRVVWAEGHMHFVSSRLYLSWWGLATKWSVLPSTCSDLKQNSLNCQCIQMAPDKPVSWEVGGWG